MERASRYIPAVAAMAGTSWASAIEKNRAPAATNAHSHASEIPQRATETGDAHNRSGAAKTIASAAPHAQEPASLLRYSAERRIGSDRKSPRPLSLISRSVLAATWAALRNIPKPRIPNGTTTA